MDIRGHYVDIRVKINNVSSFRTHTKKIFQHIITI